MKFLCDMIVNNIYNQVKMLCSENVSLGLILLITDLYVYAVQS